MRPKIVTNGQRKDLFAGHSTKLCNPLAVLVGRAATYKRNHARLRQVFFGSRRKATKT
jgi:hypothetical protein